MSNLLILREIGLAGEFHFPVVFCPEICFQMISNCYGQGIHFSEWCAHFSDSFVKWCALSCDLFRNGQLSWDHVTGVSRNLFPNDQWPRISLLRTMCSLQWFFCKWCALSSDLFRNGPACGLTGLRYNPICHKQVFFKGKPSPVIYFEMDKLKELAPCD